MFPPVIFVMFMLDIYAPTYTFMADIILGDSAEIIYILAEPTPTPYTFPDVSTDATAAFEVYHATPLFVAFVGRIAAFNCDVWPTCMRKILAEISWPIISTLDTRVPTFTINAADDLFDPSVARANICTPVPNDTPVTVPYASTDAIEGFELCHVIAVLDAFAGLTVVDN